MQSSNISDDVLLAALRNRPKLKTEGAGIYDSGLPPVETTYNGAEEDNILKLLQDKNHLANELWTQYGGQAGEVAARNYDDKKKSGAHPRLVDELLFNRQQRHSENAEGNAKYLSKLLSEKDQLLEESEKIRDRRRSNHAPQSLSFTLSDHEAPERPTIWDSEYRFQSTGFSTSGGESHDLSHDRPHDVHGVESFIRHTNNKLPAEIARFRKLKADMARDYQRLHKPYNGELGPHSYRDWQMEDYHMCRHLVDDVVEHFLDSYFRKPLPALNKDTAHAVIEADRKKWQKQQDAVLETKNIQLVMEELLLEGTRDFAREAATEFLGIYDSVRNQSNVMYMKAVETVALDEGEERSELEGAYHLVTKTFFNLQKDRQKYKPRVWNHSQHVHLKGQGMLSDEVEQLDTDTTLLQFHDLVPTMMRYRGAAETQQTRETREQYTKYSRTDAAYWKAFIPSVSTIPVASNCRGVYSLSVSYQRDTIAVGTVHGDIIVYSLEDSPYQALRAIHNRVRGNDTLVDIAWSRDGGILASTNQMGLLQLWSMSPGGVNTDELKRLDLKGKQYKTTPPQQLTHLLALDTDLGELSFQSGPLFEFEALKELYGPTLATFYPPEIDDEEQSLQTAVCIALDNGDILRGDFKTAFSVEAPDSQSQHQDGSPSPASPVPITEPSSATPEEEKVISTIGQDLPADLFRSHKYPIIHLGFARKDDHMISVDKHGFIFVWRYNQEELGSYDWFVPYKKLKLDMRKEMFIPTTNAKPNIIFTDQQAKGKKQPNKLETTASRQKAEESVGTAGLGDLWHEEAIPDHKLFTRLYPPEGAVEEAGSLFHVVIRHTDTALLSTYLTRMYRPIKVSATRLICCRQSILGDLLHFVLLFPQYPPKEAHLTIVTVDLTTFSLTSFRCDIPLNDNKLYETCLQRNVVYCDVSPLVEDTGATYMFMNINGQLSAYSLVTGEKVLAIGDTRKALTHTFPGCMISAKVVEMSPFSQVSVTIRDDRILVFLYTSEQQEKGKYLNNIHVLDLRNSNNGEQKQSMQAARKIWLGVPGTHSAHRKPSHVGKTPEPSRPPTHNTVHTPDPSRPPTNNTVRSNVTR